MSSAPVTLAEKLVRLLGYVRRGSLDLPTGLIERDCVFRMNGTRYEDTLGRPATDPLVRLLGRGPAAYRFLLQAVRYAIPDVVVHVEDLQGAERNGLVTAVAVVNGVPRGTDQAMTASVDVALLTNGSGGIIEVGVQVGDDLLRALALGRTG